MYPVFFLALAFALKPSLAIDDASACRYLSNLLEDLPRRIPSTKFKSNEGDGFTVSLSCGAESSDVANPVWCMLFNDANCTCNITQSVNVTTDGLSLQWNVPRSKVVIYDGTLIGCFEEERLVAVVLTSDPGVRSQVEQDYLLEVKIWSTVLGLISTGIFVLPCCALSYYMTRRRKDGTGTSGGNGRRRSFQPGVSKPNVKPKDIQQGTRIGKGNGRFGEVRKAVVHDICEESPLRNLACIKIFKDSSHSNKIQWCEALRKVEFKKNLAPHPNLINFLGACSSGRQITLVVELGVFGTLHAFLEAKSRARMHAGSDSCTALEEGRGEHMDVAYAKGCPPPAGSEMKDIFTAPLDRALTNENILAIAEQIAKGLLHLSQLSIVHQRLTCESVYIGASYSIKVGGFACEKFVPDLCAKRRPSMRDDGPQLTEKTPSIFVSSLCSSLRQAFQSGLGVFKHSESKPFQTSCGGGGPVTGAVPVAIYGGVGELVALPALRRTDHLKLLCKYDEKPRTALKKGRLLAWWCAPEVIECLTYSQASDVWSFAMTLWELASDGDIPMQGCGAHRTTDLPEIIRIKGRRPLKPTICSDMLFGIMQDCWEADPSNRPGLAYVSMQLSQLLRPLTQGQGQPSLSRVSSKPPPLPDLVEDEEEQ